MKLLKETTGWILYLFMIFIIFMIRILPYDLAIYLGRLFGILAWLCIPLYRKISETQIRAALGPGVNEKLMSLEVFMRQGDIFIDTVKFAYMDEDELEKHISIEGRENIEAAIASNRGVFMFTGHMNWEILGHIPKLLGIDFCIMADIIKNQKIRTIVEGLRSRCGFTLLPPRGGMVALLTDELRNGRTVGMVIDQCDRGDNRVFCNIFGMPAPTSPAPALIALRGGALILPVTAVKNGRTYTFCFHKTIDAAEFGDDFKKVKKLRDAWKSQAVQELSCYMQSCMCSAVKKYPRQYFWPHCRWLRRSEIKDLIEKGADFKERVNAQAAPYLLMK